MPRPDRAVGLVQSLGDAQKRGETADHPLLAPVQEGVAAVMVGATAFAESIDKLRENLPEVKPHFICSVPRVFEKVYAGVLATAISISPPSIFNAFPLTKASATFLCAESIILPKV